MRAQVTEGADKIRYLEGARMRAQVMHNNINSTFCDAE
jgi:hypothetical protein